MSDGFGLDYIQSSVCEVIFEDVDKFHVIPGIQTELLQGYIVLPVHSSF